MRILAIDPGYDRCGVAVVEAAAQPAVLFSACITTQKSENHATRLATVYEGLEAICKQWNPDTLALETLFFSINKTTALKVAEARGVALLLAGVRSLPVIELSPQEVKLAMTGIGNASKAQIQKMVQLSMKIYTKEKIDDEIDAIALGVAAIQKARVDNFEKRLANKK